MPEAAEGHRADGVPEHPSGQHFEAGDPRDELLFLPDDATSAVSRRVSTAGYRIERFHAVENPHSYLTSRGWPDFPPDRAGPPCCDPSTAAHCASEGALSRIAFVEWAGLRLASFRIVTLTRRKSIEAFRTSRAASTARVSVGNLQRGQQRKARRCSQG